MKRMVGFFLLTILTLLSSCGLVSDVSSVETRDNAGQQRMVTTSVALCEIFDQLELNLVGVPQTSAKLPERYDGVMVIGAPMSPDIELIKSVRPTEVFIPNTLQYDLQNKFETIQVPTSFVNLTSVEGMMDSILLMGQKYDREKQAEEIVGEFQLFMEEYNQYLTGKEQPKVLILMGLPGSYMVATENAYVGNLVKLAGGVNVFTQKEALLNLNTEAIAQTDPDVILRAAHGLPDEVKASFEKEFRENDIWKHFRAVQEGRVYDLDSGIFQMSANLSYQKGIEMAGTYLYGQKTISKLAEQEQQ